MKNDILVQTRFRNNILWGLMCGRSGAEVSCEIGIQNTSISESSQFEGIPSQFA